MTEVATNKKAKTDFTEGSVIGSIVKMGLPSMIGFLSGHLYSLADMYWLANLPERETAVAAVTIFSNILWFFFSFNQLVGPGSVAIISRRYGEKEYDRAETAIDIFAEVGFRADFRDPRLFLYQRHSLSGWGAGRGH